MRTLLLALAAAAWLQDGALRRWVDPRIARRPLADAAGWCLAGVVLAAAAVVHAIVVEPRLGDAGVALALALVALCLAAEPTAPGDAVAASLRRWRAVIPVAGGCLVALLLTATPADAPRAAAALVLAATAMALLAALHPALDARLRAARFGASWRRGPALVLLAGAAALGVLGLGLRLP